jgi:hypothetical protein
VRAFQQHPGNHANARRVRRGGCGGETGSAHVCGESWVHDHAESLILWKQNSVDLWKAVGAIGVCADNACSRLRIAAAGFRGQSIARGTDDGCRARASARVALLRPRSATGRQFADKGHVEEALSRAAEEEAHIGLAAELVHVGLVHIVRKIYGDRAAKEPFRRWQFSGLLHGSGLHGFDEIGSARNRVGIVLRDAEQNFLHAWGGSRDQVDIPQRLHAVVPQSSDQGVTHAEMRAPDFVRFQFLQVRIFLC